MQSIDNRPEDTVFEVILYSENKSWAFSSYEKAHTTQDALEQAEKYFSLYLVHRDFNGLGKTAYACIICESCARWFAKHSGTWEPAQHPLEIPLPPPVGISGKHALALVL
jgi:hypothetical protein